MKAILYFILFLIAGCVAKEQGLQQGICVFAFGAILFEL